MRKPISALLMSLFTTFMMVSCLSCFAGASPKASLALGVFLVIIMLLIWAMGVVKVQKRQKEKANNERKAQRERQERQERQAILAKLAREDLEEQIRIRHEIERREAEIDAYLDYEDYSNHRALKSLESNGKPGLDNSMDMSEVTLEDLLAELTSMVGLESVKQDVKSLVNLLQIKKIREERGLEQPDVSLHLVFSGNPGTGKTTVARLLAAIYHKIGVLSKGQLIEVDRAGLVAGYVGQTAIKVQEVVNKAKGGILFIDEAYSLTVNKGGDDFGLEAVEALLKLMEDNRGDLIVIVAGYTEHMQEFLRSNPGLRSRFNRFIHFEDYKPAELFDIFMSMCNKSHYIVEDDASAYIKGYFEQRYLTRDHTYANGRDARNYFEMALVNQANRLSAEDHITNEKLTLLTLADVRSIVL